MPFFLFFAWGLVFFFVIEEFSFYIGCFIAAFGGCCAFCAFCCRGNLDDVIDVCQDTSKFLMTRPMTFVVLFFHTKDYGVNLKEDCSKENHKECEKILFKQKFNDQWIEPGKTESFVMKLIEENVGKISPIKKLIIFDKNLVSKSQSKDGVLSNWSWNITSEVGLVIK